DAAQAAPGQHTGETTASSLAWQVSARAGPGACLREGFRVIMRFTFRVCGRVRDPHPGAAFFSLGREDVFNDVAQFLAELPGLDPALFFGPEQQTHHLAVAPSALGECMQNLDHFMFERDTNRPPAPLWRHTMLLAQGQKKGPQKSQGKLLPVLATTPMARTSRRI